MSRNLVRSRGGWRRGEAGVVTLDEPAEAPEAAEVAPEAPETPSVPVDGPPAGSAADVLAWVDSDPARAEQAWVAEQLAESPRSTLLGKLDTIRRADP